MSTPNINAFLLKPLLGNKNVPRTSNEIRYPE